ncbi:MAG TPA: UDP-N-acetylmuramoyl-L-alanyl-D-glutamate--2,6-diaminopimelate ligase [Yinghuangia sp.]|nr:UDP-N-acetylmuramoyl-L-alanyl-D-glutamate--2,6-diaminopimelate ligase [Yinghuangia sp.]
MRRAPRKAGSLTAVSDRVPRRPTRVPPRPLSGLYALLGLAEPAPDTASDTALTGVTHDSRAVRPGDLYAALPGSRAHGADFAAQAAALGAAAVLTDPAGAERARATGLPAVVVPDPRGRLGEVAAWVYGRPGDGLLLFGATGTNGKTTTAYLLDGGLRAAGHVTGLVGTVETRVGELVEASAMTTPEATDLQALFAAMAEHGVTAASMEVSSHALALGRVDGTVFDVALFTNLTQDHLDFHGSMEEYFRAKADLFTPRRARAGVADVDDSSGARIAETATIPVTTVSPSGTRPADWRVEDTELGPHGSRFRLIGPDGAKVDASVRLPGPFNVANAALAIVAQVVAGIPLDIAAAGVAGVAGVPGRMEHVDEGAPFTTVVDFAHTPDAVETALHALREVTEHRLFVVLGCGGDRDRTKRPLMGAAAVRLADVAVLTSDNPRSEDPRAILDEMLAGAREVPEPHGELVVEPDRAAAIAWAVNHAAPGDVVVVAGKGHEQGQKIGDEVRPFDDRVEVRAALRRRFGAGTPADSSPDSTAGAIPGAPEPAAGSGGKINPAAPTTEPAAHAAAGDRAVPPSEETQQ